MADADLDKVTPPKDLTEEQSRIVFEFFLRRLAVHRNSAERFAVEESRVATSSAPAEGISSSADDVTQKIVNEINEWASGLLQNAWTVCRDSPGERCPPVNELTDTSTRDLGPLPSVEDLQKIITVLLLNITQTKRYSSHTRAFLSNFADGVFPGEGVIAETLKNPKAALEKASQSAQSVKDEQSSANKTWRRIGIGASAVAGGALIGITGGLAAPLVGAGVTTVLTWLGASGTAAGLLASGLAGSSAVCGALFGAYGAHSSGKMAERHLRDVQDFAVLPIHQGGKGRSGTHETLAVRICVSGWISEPSDVTAPWTIFDPAVEDTFALQWEIAALESLSKALGILIKSHAMKYVKSEIIKRTVFASLMASLSPIAWLKLGQIIDNPWSNARARALKTGILLATLLKQRAFGTRPVTLVGYSLGSLVILTALDELSRASPEETAHLVHNVFLMGTPAPAGDRKLWTRARRVVAGRLVNAYVSAEDDYVLAVLARVSISSLTTAATSADWNVAGLQPVSVAGIENIHIEGVMGHVQWRGMVGRSLATCGATGLDMMEVKAQEEEVGGRIKSEMEEMEKAGSAEEEKAAMEHEGSPLPSNREKGL